MKLNKKGMTQMWWILGTAVLVAIVVVLGIIFVKGGFDKGGGFYDEQLNALKDYDYDFIMNRQDKCPCTPAGEVEATDLKGCPKGITKQQADAEWKKLRETGECPVEMVPEGEEVEVGMGGFSGEGEGESEPEE